LVWVVISFAPGTTGIYTGRPKPTPQIRLFTFFIEKTLLRAPVVSLGRESFSVEIPSGSRTATALDAAAAQAEYFSAPPGDTNALVTVPLIRLALARSGDKGDTANIAIIARKPEYVDLLRREVTVERMAALFRHLVDGPIRRYEAPGLHAFNFVLEHALGGGGMASLRIDPQGKAYGPMALEMLVRAPRSLLRL
jgi:hypothetical protein